MFADDNDGSEESGVDCEAPQNIEDEFQEDPEATQEIEEGEEVLQDSEEAGEAPQGFEKGGEAPEYLDEVRDNQDSDNCMHCRLSTSSLLHKLPIEQQFPLQATRDGHYRSQSQLHLQHHLTQQVTFMSASCTFA